MTQSLRNSGPGLRITRVSGWDQVCEVFLTSELQGKLREKGPALALLNDKSEECLLVETAEGTPLLFLGFVPFTLLGGEVYIWMIPFRALGLSHLREMKILFDQYAKKYTKITAQILHAETRNRRWLRFFGFKEVLQANGLVVYERSA